MTEIEAIKERHSVRNYESRRLPADKIKLLEEKIAELNDKGNLHLQFIEDAGNTYNRLMNKAMALLAPTAVNQQKFEIAYQNGEVIFKDKGGPFSKIDLGIVKYHFEVGAEYERAQRNSR